MRRHIEVAIPQFPIRDADRRVTDTTNAERTKRVDELRRQVQAGEYDTIITLDAVARRILSSGDL